MIERMFETPAGKTGKGETPQEQAAGKLSDRLWKACLQQTSTGMMNRVIDYGIG
ncbi:hypothetical protein [Heyndrickxia acidicola]|uniref:SAM-dependent methyltransferase n=1 Tax=Heyndrickxia acidicola TaxID=209389 RepID=A0ABU6MK63_9BACI|nr:hypothetical protein [Heyndrickxia acidicola]MED1205077.1 hypothetical protein [Heyndrickxia acidicola]